MQSVGRQRGIAPPPFWSEKYENAPPKRVFNNIFVILGGLANPDLTFLQYMKIMNIFI